MSCPSFSCHLWFSYFFGWLSYLQSMHLSVTFQIFPFNHSVVSYHPPSTLISLWRLYFSCSTLHSPTSPIGVRSDLSDSDRILSSPSSVRAQSDQNLSSVRSESELSPSSVQAQSNQSPIRIQSESELKTDSLQNSLG